jgi:uncharacterized protein (DUF58 family)
MSVTTQKYTPDKNIADIIQAMTFRAKTTVEGFITGLHKSPFHGFSAEFSQHRQYMPGDELKRLDWKVLARTNRLYVKEFEDETNLRCTIILDASGSMQYRSEKAHARFATKYEYAVELSAAFAFLMMRQRDAAGVAMFGSAVQRYFPPRSAFTYLQEIYRALLGVEPQGGTAIATSLHSIAEQISRRGLVILISDLWDDTESTLSALRHFRHYGHEVIVLHILDPAEMEFDFRGATIFRDMETGEQIQTQPQQLKMAYLQQLEARTALIRSACMQQHIDYHAVSTGDSFDKAFQLYLNKRRQMR